MHELLYSFSGSEFVARESVSQSFPFTSELEDSAARAVRKSLLTLNARRTNLFNRKSIFSAPQPPHTTDIATSAAHNNNSVTFVVNKDNNQIDVNKKLEYERTKSTYESDASSLGRDLKHLFAGHKVREHLVSPSHSNSVHGTDKPAEQKDNIIVDCVVILQQFKVLIGEITN